MKNTLSLTLAFLCLCFLSSLSQINGLRLKLGNALDQGVIGINVEGQGSDATPVPPADTDVPENAKPAAPSADDDEENALALSDDPQDDVDDSAVSEEAERESVADPLENEEDASEAAPSSASAQSSPAPQDQATTEDSNNAGNVTSYRSTIRKSFSKSKGFPNVAFSGVLGGKIRPYSLTAVAVGWVLSRVFSF